ncbi:MAG: STAS-like domain-containing protein [Dehalococcoidia bacterium]
MESIRLRQLGTALATRHRAQIVCRQLRKLSHDADNQPIFIDFSEVVAVSPSFVDEFLGCAHRALIEQNSDLTFVIVGVSEPILNTLEAVSSRRGLGLPCAVSKDDYRRGKFKLLGGKASRQPPIAI